MKIKVKKKYDDIFEAMKDIGDKLFKGDGEPDITEFLKDGNTVTFDLDEGVEFDVLVKDGDVPKRKLDASKHDEED